MEKRSTGVLGWWQLPLLTPLLWRVALISATAAGVLGIGWSWSPEINWEFDIFRAMLAAISFGAFTTLATQWRLTSLPEMGRMEFSIACVGVVCSGLYFTTGEHELIRGMVAALGIAFGSGKPTLVSRTRLSGRMQRRPVRVLLLITFGATLVVALDLTPVVALPFGLLFLLGILAVPRITLRSDVSSLRPIATWRGDALHALTVGTIFGCVAGLAVMANWNPFSETTDFGPDRLLGGSVALGYYTLAGIACAILAHSSGQIWIAALWLHAQARTPLRIIKFLEDARRRGIMRTVGAVYQFRHATFQERLAANATTSAKD